eukprot:TRINITY_DN12953_c0_g1_i1.p1 TRINITY_DN12953_c0_g1~~TRINITY_DN12953_c0_g1_i1.p1  ORF type:complete len:125 (-),score=31.60 TRINITY_DN12953_c0_g1_i1:72-446(-)
MGAKESVEEIKKDGEVTVHIHLYDFRGGNSSSRGYFKRGSVETKIFPASTTLDDVRIYIQEEINKAEDTIQTWGVAPKPTNAWRDLKDLRSFESSMSLLSLYDAGLKTNTKIVVQVPIPSGCAD